MKVSVILEGIFVLPSGKKEYNHLEIDVYPTNLDEYLDYDDWFTNLDKSEIMEQYFIDLLINWEISKLHKDNGEIHDLHLNKCKRELTNMISTIYKEDDLEDLLLNTFITYSGLYETIKYLPIEQQLEIILKCANFGLKVKDSFIDEINKLLFTKKLWQDTPNNRL